MTGVEKLTHNIIAEVRDSVQKYGLNYSDVVRAINHAEEEINEVHRQKEKENCH